MRFSEKPRGLKGPPQPVARRVAEAEAGCGDRADAPRGQVFLPSRVDAGVDRRRTAPPPSAARGSRGDAADFDAAFGTGRVSRPGNRPVAAHVKTPDRFRQAQALRCAGRSPARRLPAHNRSSTNLSESP